MASRIFIYELNLKFELGANKGCWEFSD